MTEGWIEEAPPPARARVRDAGVTVGQLSPGPRNALTDVDGVLVGHRTCFGRTPAGKAVRTGVTVVLPHGGNLFRDKVPAAVHVINAFGKAAGTTQVNELGVLETPIALTNTLSVGAAFEGLVLHALTENPEIGRTTGTVNPLVGECSDAALNDIRGLHVRPADVLAAIAAASTGEVPGGAIGAGTGMVCYGWKGGIGTSSRRAATPQGRFTLGALVLANFGRPADLVIAGVPVGRSLRPPAPLSLPAGAVGGSCIVVLATDAPLDHRQLGRVARRAQNGLAQTGAFGDHGSGEYVLAFSTARHPGAVLPEDGPSLDPLFAATVEAVAEAVVDCLFVAPTTTGRLGTCDGLPVDDVRRLLSAR